MTNFKYSNLSAALHWLHLGVAPVPIRYRSKAPAIQWSEYQTRLPTEQLVRSWFTTSLRNVAIVTGWLGLTVIDFDSIETFYTWWHMFARNDVWQTYSVMTGRGVHLYYWIEEPPVNASAPGIDVKGQWGYVLVPPSTHPSGTQYSVLLNVPVLRIATLGEVIPPALLESAPHPTEHRYATPEVCNDPFSSAMNTLDGGGGVVNQLRARFRVEDFFPDREPANGTKRWWVARCPFHDDHRPSFWLDVQQQMCGCYVCRMKPMDVINLFARLHGMENDEAVQAMRML